MIWKVFSVLALDKAPLKSRLDMKNLFSQWSMGLAQNRLHSIGEG